MAGYHRGEAPRRAGRKARLARLTVRFGAVTLKPPRHRSPETDLELLTVWAG